MGVLAFLENSAGWATWARLLALAILITAGPPWAAGQSAQPNVSRFQISQSWGIPVIAGGVVAWCDPEGRVHIFDVSTVADLSLPATRCANQASIHAAGNLVVWADERNGDLDVFAYDLTSPGEFPVEVGPGNQTSPTTNGQLIVWQDKRDGNWDIYGYDLRSGQELRIAVGPDDEESPNFLGDFVWWSNNTRRLVLLADIATGSTRTYDEATRDPDVLKALSLSSRMQVLLETRLRPYQAPFTDLYGIELPAGTRFLISEYAGVSRLTYQGGDPFVVYEDHRLSRPGSPRPRVYGYDLATGVNFPISDGEGQRPAISGNTVVWVQRDGIWGAHLTYPADSQE